MIRHNKKGYIQMNRDDWGKRIRSRADMASRLAHLTKGKSDKQAYDNLWIILTECKLRGSGNSGFINGKQKAVCLQELPLSAIAENLLYEDELNSKIRYSPFGIRFTKQFIYKHGGRPVIYEDKNLMKKMLPEDEYWRIVDLDLNNPEAFVDWTHEREWRVPGDLKFKYSDIEIIVKNGLYYRKLINRCIEEERLDILRDIHGIITLNSVYL